MKFTVRPLEVILLLLSWTQLASAFSPPTRPQLPNIDNRRAQSSVALTQQKKAGLTHLQAMLPSASVDLDKILATPNFVSVRGGFLTGANGSGPAISTQSANAIPANDPYHATKAFLEEHRELFGHGSEVLTDARIKRDYTDAHNGLHSVVWEQQLDGIAVFEGTLISHTTKKGELVNLSSHFLATPAQAADDSTTNRAALQKTPAITAEQAIALAVQDIGETLPAQKIVRKLTQTDAEKHAIFRAPALDGEVTAHLVWLPMIGVSLRLCWEIVFVSHSRGEMFKTLVDAQTGEIQVRRNLTDYLSDATYRVYTGDSPTPFSPGLTTPATMQPATVSRVLVTTNAYDTNASPAGWMNDDVNETLGNNVDAHTDHTGSNTPDLPRPQGSPDRTFDFPLNLSQDPTTYANAAVTQLFFLCNWYHDRLYELGFTEAAGNFQNTNFNRGGVGGDAVQADAQDGSDFDNADFSTPPDGSPGRMQMYLFDGPSPRRDGDLDAEVVFHEHTHGVSNRLIGGGVGISAAQTAGMGEGWSDFYALCLLSDPADDVDASYPFGAYVSYLLNGLPQNYYYGIRHYPYSTDMNKNPFTFKDIDPTQAIPHTGVPISPIMPFYTFLASEVHHQGEVWCSMLWEARANIIKKSGWNIGNELILKLVTDGMKLSPANPTFTQARDAIVQADMIDTGGANTNELWAAFAKRGLGYFAYAPSSFVTSGIVESFALPDTLSITPLSLGSAGLVGGPFAPSSHTFTLNNLGSGTIHWSVGTTNTWLTLTPSSGILTPANPTATVTVLLDHSAYDLPLGIYRAAINFTNNDSGISQSHLFSLSAGLDYFTEDFNAPGSLHNVSFTFTPDGSVNYYSVCRQAVTNFSTNPNGGQVLPMQDDNNIGIVLTNTISLYGTRYNIFYIGSNGYLTMDTSDYNGAFVSTDYFDLPRAAGWFDDLNPSEKGTVSWKQLNDRIAVTYSAVTEFFDPNGAGGYVGTNSNNFQIEMFFNGTIRLTYLQMDAAQGIMGLSQGLGTPDNFQTSDFNNYSSCQPVSLSASQSGTNVVLSWPARGGAYVLQQSASLNSPAWNTIATQPNFDGTRFTLTNNAATNRFFRLRN